MTSVRAYMQHGMASTGGGILSRAGLPLRAEGLAAQFFNKVCGDFANAFLPVLTCAFLPCPHNLAGVAGFWAMPSPLFPSRDKNHIHGTCLRLFVHIVADGERNGGVFACVQKDFAGLQK